jgi:Tfp pilus assembly protein PilF
VALDLAYVFQTDRRTADAVEMYRTAIRLAPEQALAYKNLGFLLLELGAEPAEVVELLEKYLSFEPDDPDTALIRQRLESLLGGQ